MAIDEALAGRVRDGLSGTGGIEEKKMFGGIAWMLGGNMALGITGKGDLMVRVGADAHQDALRQPGARPMDFAGRPMVGMVFVGPTGIKNAADLRRWIDRALRFVTSLPAKAKKPSTKARTVAPTMKKGEARKKPAAPKKPAAKKRRAT